MCCKNIDMYLEKTKYIRNKIFKKIQKKLILNL